MGDHVRALSRAWWTRVRVGGVLALAVTLAGCSGTPDAESAAAAADAVAQPSAAATTRTTAPAEPAAAELTASAVNPSGDGAADVEATTASAPAVEAEPADETDEADEADEVAAASPAPEATPLGTPEEPVRGPEPRGILGSWLRSVAVEPGAAGTEVMLRGDGQFRYSSFGLEDPSRVVVDLEGVGAAEPWSSIPAGDGPVERVRAAQHRVDPEPVTRIVVDLGVSVAPVIEPLPTGLRLFFPRQKTRQEAVAAIEAEANPAAETSPEVAPAPAPRPVPDPESRAQAPPPETQDIPAEPAPEPTPEPAPAPAPEPEPTPEPAPEPAPAPTSETPLVVESPADDEVRLRNDDPAAGQDESTSGFESQRISQAAREYHGEPISLNLTDADLKDTLQSLAEISGLNIVVHPDVSGLVTVNMRGVPWDQVLDQVLKMNDLSYEIEGSVMRVAPRAQFQEEAQAEQEQLQLEALSTPLQTVIKRVSYGTASEVAAVLRGETGASVLSERGSVVVDDRTNTLIIRELPRYMDTVLSIVEHLDAAEPQVHIEARIVETNKEFSRTLGIQWGFAGVADAAHGNTTGLEFPNNVSGEGAVNLIRGNDNGVLSLSMGNVLNTFTLDATLQAAENDGLANILSTPSVTVLNNEQAEIQSGVSVPIQTVANNTVSVQFVNATLRLLVTPHVTADGTVLLDIDIQKRQPRPDLLVADATNLPIATREARTRVIVRDGGTTVIGGIYEVETNEAEDRVPGLANIPLLGHLFRNKSRQESNDELLIFITPRVLKL